MFTRESRDTLLAALAFLAIAAFSVYAKLSYGLGWWMWFVTALFALCGVAAVLETIWPSSRMVDEATLLSKEIERKDRENPDWDVVPRSYSAERVLVDHGFTETQSRAAYGDKATDIALALMKRYKK